MLNIRWWYFIYLHVSLRKIKERLTGGSGLGGVGFLFSGYGLLSHILKWSIWEKKWIQNGCVLLGLNKFYSSFSHYTIQVSDFKATEMNAFTKKNGIEWLQIAVFPQ